MSDDLVRDLREGPMSFHEARIKMDAAATALEEARAEIERLRNEADKYCEWWRGERDKHIAAESELSTLRDMLVLCGELGGMGKDETPAAYLRRLIDEVAGVESLRARVREVLGPFANLAQRYDDTVSDGWIPWTEFITDHEWPTEENCRAARQLMEEVK